MKVVGTIQYWSFFLGMALLSCLAFGMCPDPAWSKAKTTPRLVVDTEPVDTILGNTVSSIAFSPDGKLMVWGSKYYTTTVKLWDLATSRRVDTAKRQKVFAVSPDGGKMVTADDTCKIAELRDVATGKKIRNLKEYVTNVSAAAFSLDGKTVAVAGLQERDKGCASQIDLWGGDMQRGKSVGYCNISVHAFAFSPDGKVLAAAEHQDSRWNQREGTILFDTKTGEKISTLKGPLPEHEEISPGVLHTVTFSPDGKTIATGGKGNVVELWDAASGVLKHELSGHERKVTSVSFSPDSSRVVSASEDATLKVWDVATGKALYALKGHVGPVRAVAYSHDGARIVSGGDDGTLHVWHPVKGKLLGIMVLFYDGEWVVTDTTGYFDGSSGSRTSRVHWFNGSREVTSRQLKARHHRPGLLAAIMGTSRAPAKK